MPFPIYYIDNGQRHHRLVRNTFRLRVAWFRHCIMAPPCFCVTRISVRILKTSLKSDVIFVTISIHWHARPTKAGGILRSLCTGQIVVSTIVASSEVWCYLLQRTMPCPFTSHPLRTFGGNIIFSEVARLLWFTRFIAVLSTRHLRHYKWFIASLGGCSTHYRQTGVLYLYQPARIDWVISSLPPCSALSCSWKLCFTIVLFFGYWGFHSWQQKDYNKNYVLYQEKLWSDAIEQRLHPKTKALGFDTEIW